MLGTFRRAVQVKILETRKKKLETRRDSIIASMVNDTGNHLFRHEYPNTPVLEDLFLELEYLEDALSGRQAARTQHATHAESITAL